MLVRRRFLEALAASPVLGTFLTGCSRPSATPDYYSQLGVRTYLNAAGTYTALTASLMPPEVIDAIRYAAKSYVKLTELNEAVGTRIAKLLGAEAAMVTAGAASALTLGTAGCMTGTDQERISRIPYSDGMKTEVIMQKTHRFGYDRAVRNCGTTIVEVETVAELEAAVNENTLLMLFLNNANFKGQIQMEEFVALGKKHSIPTFNDAAADVPPVENLSLYNKVGFDLVTFSGGKGLRGPQSSGLLMGREDLIVAARLNTVPHGDTIGRGMKVNKEEMLGLLAAIELYLNADHDAERRERDRRAQEIVDAVSGIASVQTDVDMPEIANHVPHVHIWWDESAIGKSVPDVVEGLRNGAPSIEVTPGSKEHLIVNPWMLQDGESTIVARRIREELTVS
jgi:L-seryl-tRNA(Ser) seleniumtransferase